MNKIKLVYIILLICSCPLFAQDYVVRNFSIDDGLPSSEVHDIYEDCNGFLWFATDRGIARYDGQEFMVIDQSNGLPNPVIFNFYEENPHRVWIANVLNELYAFNPTQYPVKFEPFPYNEKLKSQLKKLFGNEHYRRFWADESGNLNFAFLVGTGHVRIDQKRNTSFQNYRLYEIPKSHKNSTEYGDIIVHVDPGKNNPVQSTEIKFDSLDPGDVLIYDHSIDSLIESDYQHSFSGKRLTGIPDAVYLNGAIKFILGDRLYTYTEKKLRAQELQTNGLRILVHEEDIYVGAYGGVLKENRTTGEFEPILENVHCTDLYFDRTGGFWASTGDKGVFYIPNSDVKKAPEISDTPMIFLNLEVNDDYVIGISWDYDIYFFDHQLNLLESQAEVSFSSGVYILLRKEPLNKKYFNYGQMRFNTVSINTQPNFFGLKWHEYDSVYCFNAVLYDFAEDPPKYFPFKIPRMNDCVKLGYRHYLLATDEGLYIHHPNGDLNKFSQRPEMWTKMTQIDKFRDGYVVASQLHGLIYFEIEGDNYYVINKSKGMSSSTVSLFEIIDDSTIWTASYQGLNKVEFGDDITNIDIHQLNEHKGLISSEVMSMDYWNDTLWIGTRKGINCFPVNIDIEDDLLRPELFNLDSVTLNGNRISALSKQVEINETDALELYFTQIAYSTNSDMSYEYQVAGLDESWIPINTGYLRLANLPNGYYDVSIRSVCNEQRSEPFTFQLNVLNPWYKSWWAIIIYVLIGLLAIAIVFRILLKRADKKRTAELEKAQLELKALISQMNPHFTFNTINSIQHYILENDSRMALDYLAEFALLMRQSLDFSRREHITLQEELDFLKLYVDLESRRFGKPIEFKIHTETRYEPEVIGFPALLLQPIIENAVVHGLQGIDYQGRISLSIIEKEDYFDIEISDNGIGLTKGKSSHNNNHKSHGLDILKHRIKLYNAVNGNASDLQIIQGKEEGVSTTVKIKLYKVNHINI